MPEGKVRCSTTRIMPTFNGHSNVTVSQAVFCSLWSTEAEVDTDFVTTLDLYGLSFHAQNSVCSNSRSNINKCLKIVTLMKLVECSFTVCGMPVVY